MTLSIATPSGGYTTRRIKAWDRKSFLTAVRSVWGSWDASVKCVHFDAFNAIAIVAFSRVPGAIAVTVSAPR